MSKKTEPQKKTDLWVRSLSGLIIIALVLGMIATGRMSFSALMIVLGALSLYEWTRMLIPQPKAGIYQFATILAALVIAIVIYANSITTTPMFVMSGAVLLGVFMWFRGFETNTGKVVGGFFYIVFSLSYMGLLMMYTGKTVPGPFASPVFIPFDFQMLQVITAFMFIAVWASDSIAYVFGRLIGGPKLAPKISPKKTWAGLIGSMTGAAAALCLGGYILKSHFDFEIAPYAHLAAFGLFLGVIGQIGDLAISLFKRSSKVKDMGRLIPGHGGVLDRIDALLLIAPFYVYAALAVI